MPRKAHTSPQQLATAQLRVLATTDVHMQLRGYDYFADAPARLPNLASLAQTIHTARAEVENSILLDNGDFLQGTPMSDMIAAPDGQWDDANPHPAIAAMNALGYDAGTLGNHEFNFGLAYLQSALAQAEQPFVLSNVDFAPPYEALASPTLLLDTTITTTTGQTAQLRLGLIGFTPPQIMEWDARHLRGVATAHPILASAAKHSKALRDSGADVIIALCHSGIGHEASEQRGEDVGLALAKCDYCIDALILGHAHLLFPNPETGRTDPRIDHQNGLLAGVPCVMPGANAGWLGIIDLDLRATGHGWTVTKGHGGLRPLDMTSQQDTHSAAVKVTQATEQGHRQTLAYIRRPVGTSDVALHTYFAPIGHDPATALVAAAKRHVARRGLAGTHYEALPLLTAAAPFKSGGRGGLTNFTDIPAGPLSYKHVADLYHYPNTITALIVDGAGVRDWLERAAGLFNQLSPDPAATAQPLCDPDFPIYNFDTIYGVTYEIDPSQPARFNTETGALENPNARRIRNLRWQGDPLRDDQMFVVATNNYRAGGGGSFPGLADAKVAMATDQTTRDAILAHLETMPKDRWTTTKSWGFAPLGGIAAQFDTHPKARAHIHPALAQRLHDLGDQPNGFARFEISL